MRRREFELDKANEDRRRLGEHIEKLDEKIEKDEEEKRELDK